MVEASVAVTLTLTDSRFSYVVRKRTRKPTRHTNIPRNIAAPAQQAGAGGKSILLRDS